MKNLIKELTPYYVNEFNLIYKKNSIVISNYTSIKDFSDTKIQIKTKDNEIIIKGSKLRFSKLLNSEIKIVGEVENIEFR